MKKQYLLPYLLLLSLIIGGGSFGKLKKDLKVLKSLKVHR